ncbi:MAG: hypothetical protein LBC31_02170 [Treponema sp.]|jgi:hypothetical protein|nr:hypothetical protein [Treponema sp.]
MEFFYLSLVRPLVYRKDAVDPWGPPNPGEFPGTLPEELFRFSLNPAQARRIDPEPEPYLGPLEEAGRALPGEAEQCAGYVQLPPGRYYFTQLRKGLSREETIVMAMELQKEGLWERLKLEDRLYLRRLFEDNAPVTQIWRRIVS